MSPFRGSKSLILTSETGVIEQLNWESFLGKCGFETSVKIVNSSTQHVSIRRRGRRHHFEVVRISDNSIQLTASNSRFPIARILGCIQFKVQPNDSREIAFEIFEIALKDTLLKTLGEMCWSLTPDTNTAETDEVVELMYRFAPNLLLPRKDNSGNKHIYAHFAIINGVQFLAVSSDKYNYDDWLKLEQFQLIRKAINAFGGKPLDFVTS